MCHIQIDPGRQKTTKDAGKTTERSAQDRRATENALSDVDLLAEATRAFPPEKKKRNGFTLIEIAIVILIISILVGFFMSRMHGSLNGANVTAVKQQVLTLEGAARNYASAIGSLNYSGLSSYISSYTTATGNTSSILPQTYTSAGILNAFQGYATVGSSSNPAAFEISEPNIPPDACAQLAEFFSQHGTASCNGGTLIVISQ